MANIGPLFAPVKQARENLLTKYANQEHTLGCIYHLFRLQCNYLIAL